MKSNYFIDLMEEVQPALKESYALYDKVINYLNEIENLNKKRPNSKLSSDQKYLFIIGLLFFIFPGIKYYVSFKAKNKELNNEINEKIKRLEEKIDNTITKYNIKRTYVLKKGITAIIPKDYLYPPSDAFDCILSYFKDNKADDAKEAVNMYEEKIHRQRIDTIPKEQTYEYLLQTRGRYHADIVKKMM